MARSNRAAKEGVLSVTFAGGGTDVFTLSGGEAKAALIAVNRYRQNTKEAQETQRLHEVAEKLSRTNKHPSRAESIQIYREFRHGLDKVSLADEHLCSITVIDNAIKRCVQGQYGDLGI